MRLEDRDQVLAAAVRLGEVALDAVGAGPGGRGGRGGAGTRRRGSAPRARLAGAPGRLGECAEDLEHPAVLVAELELDDPVLQGLEARRVAEHVAELDVLARRERGEHAPLLEELALDLLHAREALLGRAEVVGGEGVQHAVELVDDQPHPELGRLVLDDEQQLVVVLGLAARVLGAEEAVQVQVVRVGQPPAQVAGDALPRPRAGSSLTA